MAVRRSWLPAIATVLFLLASGDAVFPVQASRYQGDVLWWHLTALQFVAVGGVGLAVWHLRQGSAAAAFRRAWPVALLIVVMVASIGWSVSGGRSATAILKSGAVLVGFIALASSAPVEHRLRQLSTAFGLIFFISVPIHLQSKDFIKGINSGAWGNRNNVAHAAVMILVISAGFVLRSTATSLWHIAVMAVSAWWILESGSKTPAYSVVFSALVFVGVYISGQIGKRSKKAGAATLVAGGVASLLVAYAIGLVSRALALGSRPIGASAGSRLSSLDDRARFWRALWPHATDAWLTGYGHGQMVFLTNRKRFAADAAQYGLDHPHNGFLDAFLDQGIVAVVLVGALIWLAYLASWQHAVVAPARGAWYAAIVTCAVTLNFTEPDFFLTFRPTFYVIILIAAARRPPKRNRSSIGGSDHADRQISMSPAYLKQPSRSLSS